MSISRKEKVIPLIFDSYLAVIKNSVGSNLFRNLYVKIDGKKVDATEDGWLSCAFYVSSILTLFKFTKEIHGTVDGTVRDMKKSGWIEINKPKTGSVIVWAASTDSNKHKHIGFYIGNDQAVSNDSYKKHPVSGHWTYHSKRKIEGIFWNKKLK